MFVPFGVGAVELMLLMLIAGNNTFPLGVPPAEPDPIMFRAAPDDCLFYATWMGMGPSDASSANSTERLLAEEEIQLFIAKVDSAIRGALVSVGDEAATESEQIALRVVPELIRTALTKHAAVYISSVDLDGEQPSFTGAAIVRTDDRTQELYDSLRELVDATMESDEIRDLEIEGRAFTEIHTTDQMVLSFGTRGNYIVLGIGEEAVAELFASVTAGEPEWLSELRADLSAPRPSTYSYVAIDKIVELASSGIDDPSFDRAIASFGIDGAVSYRASTGLDEDGYVTYKELTLDGPPRGLLALADGQALTANDLSTIPGNTPVALTVRLDPGGIYDAIREMAESIAPGAGAEFEAAADEAGEVLGSRIREDILESLGDRVTIYASPGDGGLITGWIASIEVEGQMVLSTANARMLGFLHAMFRDDRWAPDIRSTIVDGFEVHYLVYKDDVMPFSPSWCVSGNELLFSLFPQAIKSHITRNAPRESLAQNERLADLIDQPDARTVAVGYVDVAQVAELIYPFIQVYAHMLLSPMQSETGIDINVGDLPSLASITKHLEPSIGVIQRTESGFRSVSHQTIPRGEPGSNAPLLAAMMLPSIEAARIASRRTMSANNIKQIALSLHNFHDTHRSMPASYTIDEEGRPLLSWRVYMLPYMEQQHLYDQFHLDEPWDSEHNLSLVDQMPAIYALPGTDPASGETVYQGVFAENGPFWKPTRADVLGNGRNFGQFLDGLSNTIWVVETNLENAIPWTKPGDFEAPGMQPAARLTGNWKGGFNVGLADGSVQFLPATISAEFLSEAFGIDDGGPRFFHEYEEEMFERARPMVEAVDR